MTCNGVVIKRYSIFIIIFILLKTPLFAKTLIERDSVEPTMAIALSGGGARGVAQAGVLSQMERYGISPDYVIGTSIGAIIGGLYASGYSPSEIEEIITQTDWDEVFAFSDDENRNDLFLDQKEIVDKYILNLRFKNYDFVIPQAVSRGTRYNMFLQELFWDAIFKTDSSFNSLKYPFRAVATNLVDGASVALANGDIANAIRASSAIPLRYKPVYLDSNIYVDGGILANLPTTHAKEFNPDIIIAVNTVSGLMTRDELKVPWNIADQTISTAIKKFEKKSLDIADIVITPDIGKRKNTDFTSLQTLIDAGFDNSEAAFLEYIETYDQKYFLKIKERLEQVYNSENDVFVEFQDITYTDSLRFADAAYSIDSLSLVLRSLFQTGSYTAFAIDYDGNITIEAKLYPILKYIKVNGDVPYFLLTPIRKMIDAKYNRPINKKLITEVYDEVNRRYREKDYSAGGVISHTVRDDTLFLEITDGIIKKIEIISDDGINPSLITRDLDFKEGQPLNAEKLSEAWYKLSNSDLFSDVRIFPTNIHQDSIIVRIVTVETGAQSLRLGARIDSERNGQVAIEAAHENLFNKGERFSIGFTGGTLNQKYQAELSNRRIFNTLFFAKACVYYNNRDYFEYYKLNPSDPTRFADSRERNLVEENYGSMFSIGRQVETTGILSVNFRFEKQRLYHIDSLNKPNFSTINTVMFKGDFDTNDERAFPHEGNRIILSLETNLFNIKGGEAFSKLQFYYQLFQSFGDHTLIPKLHFGAADKTLPAAEFFSLGGEDSFYGLREDESRGRQIFTGSLEYRYKLPLKLVFDTYCSIRYDLGTTWIMPESIKFSSLQHGVGTRISWDTPLGPAAISLGRAFVLLKDPAAIDWGQPIFYFSIGMKM